MPDSENSAVEYVVIRVKSKYNTDKGFPQLGAHVEGVHVVNVLAAWAAKKICKQCPGLKSARFPRWNLDKYKDSDAIKYLKSQGIEIIEGHDRPNFCWKGLRLRHSELEANHKRLLNLSGESLVKFQEMKKLKIREAKFASRYYCLNGEKYMSQNKLGQIYGYSSKGGENSISRGLRCFLTYIFGDQLPITEELNYRAMIARIRKERYLHAENKRDQEIFRKLKISHYPEGLPNDKKEIFFRLALLKKNGRFDKILFKKTDARKRKYIKLAFGLDILHNPTVRVYNYTRIAENQKPPTSRQSVSKAVNDGLKRLQKIR